MAERVELAIDLPPPQAPLLLRFELPRAATVAALLAEARARLPQAPVEWETAACGVWGERCGRDRLLRDGDRLELYQPLTADPRARRRARVRRARRGRA
jgi:putative ubiquitin-RnfH superfamily antitoxin RatB of RatAB toxin-antitoxin module